MDTGRVHDRNRYYLCRCDCGGGASIRADRFRSGETKTCGNCIKPKVAKPKDAPKPRPVGKRKFPKEYAIWIAMKTRCKNPNHNSYRNYGGRGISVCPEWDASFEAFIKAMGPKPDGRSIDRIDGDGNYEPGNCRWATQQEQSANRRCNTRVTIDGTTYPSLAVAAAAIGVTRKSLSRRLQKGADPRAELPRLRPRKVTLNGVEYASIKEASIELGVPYMRLYHSLPR